MKPQLTACNILGLIALCFLAACAQKPAGKIIIRGSNTVGEELAPRLIAEYNKSRPGIDFDTEFKGTTFGIGALMVGGCDITAASREISPLEKRLANERSITFNEYPIGNYTVAVVVNAANPVHDLSLAQVRDIFSGSIQNWKDVGGPDAPIVLYIRDPISGTHLGFQEVAMEKKSYALNVTPLNSHSDIIRAVASGVNAIGYASVEASTAAGVKVVSIGGVAPTAQTVQSGLYPYHRLLRFYTDKPRETPAARAFIEFVRSAQGQQIVRELGYVPQS